ncbi:MAG: terminase family protein [Methylotetracoccus sp.]
MSAVQRTDAALTLYPFQKRWIEDASRFKVGMFARQCGKTFSSTLELVLDCIQAEAAGGRRRWVILSRGERQAREAMDEGVKRHLQALRTTFQSMEFDWSPSIRAMEVVLPGGSKITALPANPDTARGFSASVLLDEFAFHQDSRKIWQALFPVISKPELKLRVISTPNGKGNKFYDLVTAEGETWSKHVVDIYQAVEEGLPRNADELRAGMADEDAWFQEYELQWLDEASSWLPFALINGAESDECVLGSLSGGERDIHTDGMCFVGVDIAARNDLFVIWVLEVVGDVWWTREIITRRRASFAEQDFLLAEVFRAYRVMRLCMDQTGMGEKPVEDAKRRYGSARVEGVLFTGPAKQALAIAGKEAFEDRKIRVPKGDQALRADLHKLKKVQTATGAPRFLADSDEAGHADRAWACFLACYAAGSPVAPIEYQTIPNKVERWNESRRPTDGGVRIQSNEGCW